MVADQARRYRLPEVKVFDLELAETKVTLSFRRMSDERE